MENQEWSKDGCSLIQKQPELTVCECNHLTNFGLLFGGSRTENDEIKSKLSNILAGISIVFLVFTQLALHFNFGKYENKKFFTYPIFTKFNSNLSRKQPTPYRRTVELNRNYALILGLATYCYLVELPGGGKFTHGTLCATVAFITHYLWLVVFAWTSKYQLL